MKKFAMITCVFGCVLAAIGLTVLLAGLAKNDWKWPQARYVYHTFTGEGQLTALDVEVAAGDAEIVFYDGETVTVEYPASKTFGYSVTQTGGTVRVDTHQSPAYWLTGSWQKLPKLTVHMPRTAVPHVELDISAGDVQMDGGVYGNFDLDMSAGKLTLGDITCKSFEAELSAGKADIGKVVSEGAAEVNLSAGKCSVGSLNAPSLAVGLSAGDLDIGKSAIERLDIDLSAGNFTCELLGNPAEYTVRVRKSAGSCNLNDAQGSDLEKRIDVDISAGGVRVTFSAA